MYRSKKKRKKKSITFIRKFIKGPKTTLSQLKQPALKESPCGELVDTGNSDLSAAAPAAAGTL